MIPRAQPPGPVRLYVVTDGATDRDPSERFNERPDSALGQLGEERARSLGRRLEGTAFAGVLVSPLARARRTRELAGYGRIPLVEPDLAEWDFGLYGGRGQPDVRRERPTWSLFEGCPGGETLADVLQRADRLLLRLHRMKGDLVLFTHQHFACALAARWVHLASPAVCHLQLCAGSISILGYDSTHRQVPIIERWNALPLASEPNTSQAFSPADAAIQRWENEGGEIPSISYANPR